MAFHLEQSCFKNGEQTGGASPYDKKIGFDHDCTDLRLQSY
jgi:hypothetical protein